MKEIPPDLNDAFELAETKLGYRTPLGHLADVLVGAAQSKYADELRAAFFEPFEHLEDAVTQINDVTHQLQIAGYETAPGPLWDNVARAISPSSREQVKTGYAFAMQCAESMDIEQVIFYIEFVSGLVEQHEKALSESRGRLAGLQAALRLKQRREERDA